MFDVSLPRISWSLFVYSRSISLSTALSISPKSSSESDEVSSSLIILSDAFLLGEECILLDAFFLGEEFILLDSFLKGEEFILSEMPLFLEELIAPPLPSFYYPAELGFSCTLIGFLYVSTSSRFYSTSIFSFSSFIGLLSDKAKSNSVC